MAVRVRLRLEKTRAGARAGPLEVTAFVNSGYEAAEDEFSIPPRLAETLGVWPTLPPSARTIVVHGYTGAGNVHLIPKAARVRVIEPDRARNAVVCSLVIAPADDEALISDHLAGSLGISLLNPSTGEWCFRGEKKTRHGHPPQRW